MVYLFKKKRQLDYVFLISSLYHMYNSLKILELEKIKENNTLGFIIAESHKKTIEGLKISLDCLKFKIHYISSYKLYELYGIKGLIKKLQTAKKIIKELREFYINNFFTANDKEFISQILLNELNLNNISHIEDGLDIYINHNSKEPYGKFLIKKILYPKYVNLPYLGLHPKIKNIWVSNKNLVPYSKFKNKKILEIPNMITNNSFLHCIAQKFKFFRFIPNNSFIFWIVTNSEIIKNKYRYLQVYKNFFAKIEIDNILLKFHPRENSNDFKMSIINLLKDLRRNIIILHDSIATELFISYLLSIEIKPIILGDISTAIFQSKIIYDNTLPIISKLKEVLDTLGIDPIIQEQISKLHYRLFIQ